MQLVIKRNRRVLVCDDHSGMTAKAVTGSSSVIGWDCGRVLKRVNLASIAEISCLSGRTENFVKI